MRERRRQQATRGLVVLALLLGSLWAGGLASSRAGGHAGQLTASRPLLGVEAAALPDRPPALRPAAERPDPTGRLLPLLGGLLAGSLAVVHGPRDRRRRPRPTPARSPVLSARQGPRAPPRRLQPA